MTARLSRWRLLACAAAVLLAGVGCTSNSADPATSTVVTTASASVTGAVTGSSAGTISSSSVATPSVASPTPASPTVSASLSPAAREAAAKQSIEAQWNRYTDLYTKVVRLEPAKRDKVAAEVAIEPARSNLSKSAAYFKAKGQDNYGTIGHRISWMEPINGARQAVLADCQDRSKFGAKIVATGEKVSVGVTRDNVRAVFVEGSDGVWRVSDIYFLVDTPC